jgi:hypothetical protein
MRAFTQLTSRRGLNSVLLAALLGWSLKVANAQVGNNNPTGPAGMFNGNIDTACSYDPFTGNGMRGITDIVVTGGVGSYPLAFTRVSNSRQVTSGHFQFGAAGGWSHSYAWSMGPSIPTTVQIPPGYEVSFQMDARRVLLLQARAPSPESASKFNRSTSTTCWSIWS